MEIHQYRAGEIKIGQNFLQVGHGTWQKSYQSGLYTEFADTRGVIAAHSPSNEAVWLGTFGVPFSDSSPFYDLLNSISSTKASEDLTVWLGGAPTFSLPFEIEDYDPTEHDNEVSEALRTTNEEIIPWARRLIVEKLGDAGINLAGATVKWLGLDEQIERISVSPDGMLRYSVDEL